MNKDKKGNITFNVIFTAQVLNSSNKKIDTKKMAEQIKSQFEKIFNVKYGKDADGSAVTINATANVSVIDKKSDLASNATLYEIVDGTNDAFKIADPTKAILASAQNGKEILVNADYVDQMIDGKTNTKTLTHEAGHTAGLQHPNTDKYYYFFGLFSSLGFTAGAPITNFMYQGRQATTTGPTKKQIYRMFQLYSKDALNKKEGVHPINAQW